MLRAVLPDSDGSARDALALQLGIVEPETWPWRYRMHKYWGRKPANVVARYVEVLSEPGALVFDPFSGSGVTLIEAARLGRRAVGMDLNPVAVRLANAMLAPPAPEALVSAARDVLADVSSEMASAYLTRCAACAGEAVLRSAGYTQGVLREVRFACACGASGARAADAADLSRASAVYDAPADAPDDDILMGWQMRKLARARITRWRELFTARNFRTAALLRARILRIEDARSREWLLLTLTASLAQCTRMIADAGREAGGPSWKINCYWLPKVWQELNPLHYFQNRVRKSVEAARDSLVPMAAARAELGDSRSPTLSRASVDYVFTDPPYGGEGIQYGELSMLWALWLDERQDLASEIAFNPARGLDQAHYAAGLRDVFAQLFHVLKPGAPMTVTFANKDPVVWDALMDACRSTGFALLTAAPMKRSLPSLTETNMATAPKADLLLNFVRPRVPVSRPVTEAYDLHAAVSRIAAALTREARPCTASDVFDRVTVDWFTWFYERGVRPETVRPTLSRVRALLDLT